MVYERTFRPTDRPMQGGHRKGTTHGQLCLNLAGFTIIKLENDPTPKCQNIQYTTIDFSSQFNDLTLAVLFSFMSMFLAAKSRCTNFLLSKYSMAAQVSLLFRNKIKRLFLKIPIQQNTNQCV